MTVSLMVRVDEPRLEPIYSWLEQHRGSSIQLFGWDANQRAALLAYGDGSGDLFGWANWMTKITDDPSTLLPVFEQLELLLDEARRVSAQRDLRRRLQRRITRDSLGPVDERYSAHLAAHGDFAPVADSSLHPGTRHHERRTGSISAAARCPGAGG